MPVRKISNATPFKTLTRMPLLSGEFFDTESLLEADNLKAHLLDPRVEEVEVQPLTVRYYWQGKPRRYTPDVLVKYRRQERPVIEEVKPKLKTTTQEFKEWECVIRSLIEEAGATFRVVTEDEIRREPRLRNLDVLLRYWQWPVDQGQRREVLSWFQAEALSLRELRRRVSLVGISIGVVFHLISRHELWVDLDQPFDDLLEVRRAAHE